jgi:diacylglycerol O-acyltransferase
MTNGRNGDRLSWGDALFLYLEREGMPLNIACVSVFEGKISLEACTRFIESKLALLPRYYQRVVAPPFNIGFPTWQYDPQFDIHNHIREVKLKHGTEAELKAAAGKILSTVMDRQRPLWDFTLVQGLRGDHTGLVVRMHHCLADGIAGIGLMNVLMDPSPDTAPLPKKSRPRRPRQACDSLTMLLDGWITSYSDTIQRVLTAQSEALNFGERLMAGVGETKAHKFSRFLPELTAPTQPLFFNITCEGPQKFAWARIPVADIKAIRESQGATHNDVVLALVTGTIRRYAELHGDKVRGRLLRMMVPVNIRGNDSPNQLGNRISLLPVTLPLNIRNPRRLLAAVHRRTELLKRAHVAEWIGMAGGLVANVPAPVQALAGPVASLLPVLPFNLVCTNVPGPQFPLYLLGHKMLAWYPYVPVGGEMALNCAALTYNSVTYFGFSGDVHAAPDLARLEKLLMLTFKELREAAGLNPPRKTKPARVKAAPAPEPLSSIPCSASTPATTTAPKTSLGTPARQEQVVTMAAD